MVKHLAVMACALSILAVGCGSGQEPTPQTPPKNEIDKQLEAGQAVDPDAGQHGAADPELNNAGDGS